VRRVRNPGRLRGVRRGAGAVGAVGRGARRVIHGAGVALVLGAFLAPAAGAGPIEDSAAAVKGAAAAISAAADSLSAGTGAAGDSSNAGVTAPLPVHQPEIGRAHV